MRPGWVERGTVMIRLTRPHFCFFRGYLDGLDLRNLADRYLENPSDTGDAEIDLRVAKSTIGWIRDQLAVAARRTGHAKSIRLFRIEPKSLNVTYAASVPTLEQYREERDPYEVYSEEDLIALFQEEYGSGAGKVDRRVARNDRLRSKQRQALTQLEELVAADPKLSDRIDGWIDPVLAKRLQVIGIDTLGDLVEFINGSGYRWYDKVPRIGEKAASQILRWLTTPEVEQALGARLHVRAKTKKRDLGANVPAVYAARTDIVPLEHFIVPSALDGSQGSNRGDRPLLSAPNDLAGLHAWLGLWPSDSHTYRAYRKEAERFLLWAIMEKGKPISSLSVEDCRDYRDFLWYLGTTVEVSLPSPAGEPAQSATPAPDAARADPRASATYKKPKTLTVFETAYWHTRFRLPQERWIGRRGAERWSPDWRPFEGKLSPSSQTTALVIIQSFLQWLTDQHYLHGNPLKGVNRLTKRADKIDARRSLTKAGMQAVKAYLASMVADTEATHADRVKNDKHARLRCLIALAYGTGMRLSELVSLCRNDFRSFFRVEDGKTGWEARVTGKGGATRDVKISHALMKELDAYFVRRGHRSFVEAAGDVPVMATLPLYDKEKMPVPGSSDDPLSESRLYEVLKTFFEKVAETVDDAETAHELKRASTHWLRHTYATHSLEAGMSLMVLRDGLGHASLNTTSVYVNTERDRSSREADDFAPTL